MKDWLRIGKLPNDKDLKQDLVGPRKELDSSGRIFLESKKKMKARGLASPDCADALAVTFFYPVANKVVDKMRKESVSLRRNGHSTAQSGAWMQ